MCGIQMYPRDFYCSIMWIFRVIKDINFSPNRTPTTNTTMHRNHFASSVINKLKHREPPVLPCTINDNTFCFQAPI